MQLYNTQTQSLEALTLRDHTITLYVCGITPYDTTHLGHAFTYAAYDHLIRYLELQGISVRYTQNVTDIDDDILKRAQETGEDWRELGRRWTNHFIDDMIALNIRPPDYFPHATDVIPQIIQAVEALVGAGVAYASQGSVYYAVNRDPRFGQLSHLPRSAMLPVANERGNHPEDPHKRDPLDFVLWQAQAPGEPAWDSPWGSGRPGWHIECSTMASQFLGLPVDIHGGGEDLCFPHHECEIAQVQPVVSDGRYVRYWMHTAMVRYQGEKMSKSLGNLVMVSDLLKSYTPDALRLYLGAHHYREAWSYNEADLQYYQGLADRLHQALVLPGGQGSPFNPEKAIGAFRAAMENDLDTAGAITVLMGLAEGIETADNAQQNVQAAQDALRTCGQVFGLTWGTDRSEERVVSGWQGHQRS